MSDSPDSAVDVRADGAVARAGAAAAARRRELGISQRSLAADGVITAAALIAFEKGRSWPRAGTRAKLEHVLQWPAGAIERLRQGNEGTNGEGTDGERTDGSDTVDRVTPASAPLSAPAATGEFGLVIEALEAAAHSMRSVVATLPPADEPEFTPRVTAVLVDLRQLEVVASRAARLGTMTPALVKTLAGMRRQYDEVTHLAATSPSAPLGQRFYSARRRASLSIAEAAHAAGVAEDVIVRAESEDLVSPADVAALESVIKTFSWD